MYAIYADTLWYAGLYWYSIVRNLKNRETNQKK